MSCLAVLLTTDMTRSVCAEIRLLGTLAWIFFDIFAESKSRVQEAGSLFRDARERMTKLAE